MKCFIMAALLVSNFAFAATELVGSVNGFSVKAELGVDQNSAVINVESVDYCYQGARCVGQKTLSVAGLTFDKATKVVSYKGVACGKAVTEWRGSAHNRFPVVVVASNGNCQVTVEQFAQSADIYLNF